MYRTIALTVLCVGGLWPVGPIVTGPGSVVAQESQESDRTASPSVDLNTATMTELQSLPRVGERTAQLIVEYRQEHGGFRKVEELMNIRGIGERTFLRLRPLVSVESPDETDR